MWVIIIIGLLSLITAIYYKARKNKIDRKGVHGEKKIAGILDKLPKDEYIVLNNLLIMEDGYSSQIDHVIISIYGIFVIETKSYKGKIYGSIKKMHWMQKIRGKKYQIYNPEWQNYSHINVLRNILYAPSNVYKSIIVFVNTSSLKIWGNSGEILSKDKLYRYIRSYTHQVLDFSECLSLSSALRKKNITDKQLRETHIINVRNITKLANIRLANGLCPLCGAKLIRRRGQFVFFWGCSRYPICRFTKN